MRLHIFIMKCVHYADGLFNPFPPKLIKAICPPQKKFFKVFIQDSTGIWQMVYI